MILPLSLDVFLPDYLRFASFAQRLCFQPNFTKGHNIVFTSLDGGLGTDQVHSLSQPTLGCR
jgi:hypothetical protein